MNNATNNATNDARIEGISMNGLTLEINTLRDQIPDLNRHDREGGIILQRFLDESTVYTESLADPNEHTRYDDTSDLEPVFEEHRPGTHQDGQRAPKKPDFRAMQATRVARSKISKVQRFELDHALEMLVRPKPRFKRFSTGDRAQEVRRLLDRGADISLPQCQSLDALSLELSNKVQRVDVVTLLLERGADPNTYSKLVNAIAYCRGCERPLLDYGASSNLAQPYGPNSQTYSGLAMSIHRKDSHSSPRGLTRLMLENYGADPNALGALAEAVSQTSFEHVALLIEKGADVRRRERGGRTALHALGLHYSIWKFGRGKPEMEKILSLLLTSGADVNAQDDGGQTPLYVACQRRNRVAVRMLLDEGADASVGLSPASALRIWRPAPVYDEKTRTTYTPYPETRHGKTGTTYIPYPETRHGKIPLQYKNGPADDKGKSRSILRMLNAPEWVP
jgi:ankyrin repeat protein